MTQVEKALVFATKAHAGQYRKGTDRPYILHPIETMVIAMTFTEDEEVLAAALLHDTVENTSITMRQIEKEFGPRVAKLVGDLTEDKKRKLPPEATWRARKFEMIFRLRKAENDTRILWFANCLSNIRELNKDYEDAGDDLWDRFNQRDKDMQGWYYKEIVEILNDDYFEDNGLFIDFADLVYQIFGC